jgi:hypothetical protein
MFVYVARYSKQPRSEIRSWPLSDFFAWHHALVELVGRENESG